MLCMLCRSHGVFERTVFRGTQPITVRLCSNCAAKHDAASHADAIKTAPNHEAKAQAVEEFLRVLGR